MSDNNTNTLQKYTFGIFHPIIKLPDNCEHLKILCDQNAMKFQENAALLAKACDNTRDGKILFICLCMGQWSASKKEAADAYESVKGLPVPETDVSTISKEIVTAYQENMRNQMGFLRKEKDSGYIVNSNAFSTYFLKRVKLVLLGEGAWFLYNRAGYFEAGSDVVVGKLVRDMLNGAVKNIWRSSTSKEILTALKLEAKQVEKLNIHRELLNLENGMLNVDTGELSPHSPKYLSTVRIPYTFDPTASCTRFPQFIREITDNDTQIADLLQELTGYLLTSETRAEKAFLLYGSGSNGKSVFSHQWRQNQHLH